MKTLKLTLNKKWFDLIKKGIKTEEYREIKSYWFTRLVFDYKKVLNYVGVCDGHLEEGIKRICEDAFWAKSFGFVPFDYKKVLNYVGVRDGLLEEDIKRICEDAFLSKSFGFVPFDLVEFRNGYNPKSPQITMECKGFEVGTGKTEWGAVANTQYFVIKLGREVGRQNCL